MNQNFTVANPSNAPNQKQLLRSQMRRARRRLSRAEQCLAASALAKRVRASSVFLRARHIALYWPNGGEINPLVLMHSGRLSKRKRWYLPVIRGLDLRFYPYGNNTKLVKNRFGIAEPDSRRGTPRKPWQLDLVLMPLVAFDNQRNRLGMGAGFYDRCFAPLNTAIRRPFLLGVAHQCQEVDAVPLEAWDVRLDAIATDGQWL